MKKIRKEQAHGRLYSKLTKNKKHQVTESDNIGKCDKTIHCNNL